MLSGIPENTYQQFKIPNEAIVTKNRFYRKIIKESDMECQGKHETQWEETSNASIATGNNRYKSNG